MANSKGNSHDRARANMARKVGSERFNRAMNQNMGAGPKTAKKAKKH